jgi:hypothetical protein
MQCAQECLRADCGAFYVQVSALHCPQPLQEDGLTCSLVPEDQAGGYKSTSNLAAATRNYFIKI